MRSLVAILLLVTLASAAARAQEGFPLDGTWRGEPAGPRQKVGQTMGQSMDKASATIVMVMQWDGQKISGVINPGPAAIPIAGATLRPEGWHVRISARTADGKPITYEGTIGKLGDYDRYIEGTWTEGGRSYKVRMVRE